MSMSLLFGDFWSHRTRPSAVKQDPSGQQPPALHPPIRMNRFRKVAECIVQVNRLAIERAREEDEDQSTEKRRHFNRELQRYEANRNDTATWLYYLVFSSESPPNICDPAPKVKPPNPTVVDYDPENPDADPTPTIDGSPDSEPNSAQHCRDVVQWTKFPEPGPVVDSLLQKWTILDAAQIQGTKAFFLINEEEEWREELIKRIRESISETEPTRSENDPHSRSNTDPSTVNTEGVHMDSRDSPVDWESSSDDEYQSAEESSVDLEARDPPERGPAYQKRARFDLPTDFGHPVGQRGFSAQNARNSVPKYPKPSGRLHSRNRTENLPRDPWAFDPSEEMHWAEVCSM